jgi:hypothetical protein
MKGLARVSVDQGTLFLSVETPYDQDVLFEHLRSSASVHRRVEFALEWLRVQVRANGVRRRRCARCVRVMANGAMRCEVARRSLCARCARALVREVERELESPAWRVEHDCHRERTDDAEPGSGPRL